MQRVIRQWTFIKYEAGKNPRLEKCKKFPKNTTTQVDFSHDHIFQITTETSTNEHSARNITWGTGKVIRFRLTGKESFSIKRSPAIIKNNIDGHLKHLCWNITKEHTVKNVCNYYLKLSVLRYRMKIITIQSELRYHHHRKTHKEMRDSRPSVISKLVIMTKLRKENVTYESVGNEYTTTKDQNTSVAKGNCRYYWSKTSA